MRGSSVKSNVRAVRYDAEKQVLEVEFHAGGLCEYYGVPLTVYQELATAEAREQYFEKHVRFRFRHRHILKI